MAAFLNSSPLDELEQHQSVEGHVLRLSLIGLMMTQASGPFQST